MRVGRCLCGDRWGPLDEDGFLFDLGFPEEHYGGTRLRPQVWKEAGRGAEADMQRAGADVRNVSVKAAGSDRRIEEKAAVRSANTGLSVARALVWKS